MATFSTLFSRTRANSFLKRPTGFRYPFTRFSSHNNEDSFDSDEEKQPENSISSSNRFPSKEGDNLLPQAIAEAKLSLLEEPSTKSRNKEKQQENPISSSKNTMQGMTDLLLKAAAEVKARQSLMEERKYGFDSKEGDSLLIQAIAEVEQSLEDDYKSDERKQQENSISSSKNNKYGFDSKEVADKEFQEKYEMWEYFGMEQWVCHNVEELKEKVRKWVQERYALDEENTDGIENAQWNKYRMLQVLRGLKDHEERMKSDWKKSKLRREEELRKAKFKNLCPSVILSCLNFEEESDLEKEWKKVDGVFGGGAISFVSGSLNGGISYGYSSIKGKRSSMEDFFETKTSEVDGQMVAFFGVFDGHGGSRHAEYLKNNLFKNLSSHPDFIKDTKTAIVEAFKQTDVDYLNEEKGPQRDAGSTASTALLLGDRIFVANVGDSRVVAYRDGLAVPLSVDHKPDRSDERQRIEQAGGFVIWEGTWTVGGVLAVFRAFGVVADPEIQEEDIEGVDWIILASDGLWNVISDKEALSFVEHSILLEEMASKRLIKEAYTRGSADNITCVIVRGRKY